MFIDDIKIFLILVNNETEADLHQFYLNIVYTYLLLMNDV